MRIPLIMAFTALALQPAAAGQEVHEHGTGRLLIAIEGGVLEAQLQAPADDIVGFEHAPANDADRAAVAEAVALLKDGSSMLALPAAAGCSQKSVAVSSPLIEDGHDHDDGHAEFVAHYKFECTAPDALGGLDTGYFRAFPRARELEVVVLSERGQAAGELTPDATAFAF